MRMIDEGMVGGAPSPDSNMVDLAPLLHHKITATPAARLPFAAIGIKFQTGRGPSSITPQQFPLHIAVIGSFTTGQLRSAPLERTGPQGSAAIHQVARSIPGIAVRSGGLKGAVQAAIVKSWVSWRIRLHYSGGCGVSRGSLIRLLGHQLWCRFVFPRQQR